MPNQQRYHDTCLVVSKYWRRVFLMYGLYTMCVFRFDWACVQCTTAATALRLCDYGRWVRLCAWYLSSFILQPVGFLLTFPSVLWHCWFGDREASRLWKSWVLACWWWFDWRLAHLIAPVFTTTSIVLSSSKTGERERVGLLLAGFCRHLHVGQ